MSQSERMSSLTCWVHLSLLRNILQGRPYGPNSFISGTDHVPKTTRIGCATSMGAWPILASSTNAEPLLLWSAWQFQKLPSTPCSWNCKLHDFRHHWQQICSSNTSITNGKALSQSHYCLLVSKEKLQAHWSPERRLLRRKPVWGPACLYTCAKTHPSLHIHVSFHECAVVSLQHCCHNKWLWILNTSLHISHMGPWVGDCANIIKVIFVWIRKCTEQSSSCFCFASNCMVWNNCLKSGCCQPSFVWANGVLPAKWHRGASHHLHKQMFPHLLKHLLGMWLPKLICLDSMFCLPSSI